jgi:hypothetical protein
MAIVAMKQRRLPIERTWFRLVLIGLLFVVLGGLAIWVVLAFELVEPKLAWLALGACVISSLVAHIAGEYPSGEDKFMARLGGGMFARTSLPFLVVISTQLTSPDPLPTGFVLLVILFYLVGLVADVSLQVLRMKTSN